MKKLALAMITKNSGKHLRKTLESVIAFIDEIVIVDNGSTDDTVAIAHEFGAKVIELNPKVNPEYFCFYNKEWWPNFTMLRRRSFEETTADWILWLDADDIVSRPDLIADKIIEAEQQGMNVIIMRYLYEVDKDGRIEREHNKERIMKRGTFQWEYDSEWAVHENPYPIKKNESFGMLVDDVVIVHEKDIKDFSKSNYRNYNILMWMLQKDKFKEDPRVYYLLARELTTLKRLDMALKMYAKYLSMEYAAHDALDSCIVCAEIHEGIGDFNNALGYSLKAVSIRPDYPLGYIYAARYYNYQGKFQDALDMLEVAEKKKISNLETLTQQPYKQSFLFMKARVDALFGLKDYENCITEINNHLDILQEDDRKDMESKRKECFDSVSEKKLNDSLTTLIENRIGELRSNKQKPEMKDFEDIFSLFKGYVRLSPLYMRLRQYCGDFRVHDAGEITIVHRNNFENWDYNTLREKGGGGSETACAELATRWANLGFKVTVYAAPEEEKDIKGVEWKRFENINLADHFNIFISLRGHGIFTEYQIQAEKKYLWLQDIMFPWDYTESLYGQLDKIIVLSKYHRNTAYNVPESKFYYTTNGIDLELIEKIEKENIKRIKNKCVYISSADRGLINLIKIWPKVKKAVASATCFQNYNEWKSWNMQKIPQADVMKKKLIKGMKKAGIIEGKRLSKEDLYRHLFSADYHTYPLVGPAETSCIAVMESQACGAIPITTGITALEETQQYGVKVPLENYEKTLIETMKANKSDTPTYRKQMMAWARDHFNWDAIAKEWVTDLFTEAAK